MLDDPSNGSVIVNGVLTDDTADYSCDEGFELVGERTRVCMNDSQWSGEAPECRCECIVPHMIKV